MAEKLYACICNTVDNEKPLLEEVSHDIWSHPEIMHEEVHAHQLLTSVLKKKGFQVQPSFVLPTAFRAEYSNIPGSKPYIAFLCEYDALPEIGHACGHNLIAESGLGAGLALQAALMSDPKLHGTVVVFGTPAEEGGGGKVDMVKAGVFKEIDICMMVHPSPVNLVAPAFIGIRRFEVRFKGQAAHACAYPWEGRNALDAAVACYNTVSMLRQQMKPTSRIHGIITKGGVAPNIIPADTEMKFYLRGATTGDMDILQKKLFDSFNAAAQATGCEVEYSSSNGYKTLITNSIVGKAFRKHAESLGVTFSDENPRGKKFVASSDVGDVSHELPTIQAAYYIGTDAPNHSNEFTAASGAPQAQPYTLKMVKSMAMAAVDFLLSPELVDEAKKQFEKDYAEDLIE